MFFFFLVDPWWLGFEETRYEMPGYNLNMSSSLKCHFPYYILTAWNSHYSPLASYLLSQLDRYRATSSLANEKRSVYPISTVRRKSKGALGMM